MHLGQYQLNLLFGSIKSRNLSYDKFEQFLQSNYWRKFGETQQVIWDAENKADFFRLPSAIPDTIFLFVKKTGLEKLIRVRVIFIICLK